MALSHEEPRSFSWAGLITRTGGTAALSAGTGTPAPVTSTIAESSETEQPDALPTQQPSAGGNRSVYVLIMCLCVHCLHLKLCKEVMRAGGGARVGDW